jgi:hypothetical protein
MLSVDLVKAAKEHCEQQGQLCYRCEFNGYVQCPCYLIGMIGKAQGIIV